jgi:hypothetical protein
MDRTSKLRRHGRYTCRTTRERHTLLGEAQVAPPRQRGTLLKRALAARAAATGQPLPGLVRELGGTEHDSTLLNQDAADTARLSPQFVAACSQYLRLPRIAVRCLAGEYTLTDFVVPHWEAGGLSQALARIDCKSLLGCLMPNGVHALDEELQRFVLRCLELASREVQLSPQFSLQELRVAMQSALAVDEALGRQQREIPTV